MRATCGGSERSHGSPKHDDSAPSVPHGSREALVSRVPPLGQVRHVSYTTDFLVWSLGRWANDMWVRFGGEGVGVYLVGSAIHNPDHKDVDVTIVLPTEVFKTRYGMTEREWNAEQTRMENGSGVLKMNEWAPAHKRWAREVGGLVHGLAALTTNYGPPDLKVMSREWQSLAHENRPRIRLDTIETRD